jgi:hypothetical protein
MQCVDPQLNLVDALPPAALPFLSWLVLGKCHPADVDAAQGAPFAKLISPTPRAPGAANNEGHHCLEQHAAISPEPDAFSVRLRLDQIGPPLHPYHITHQH